MIRLSRLTDYAVSLLARMAGPEPVALTVWAASDLAERSGLPLPTVAKIFKQLARAGIVEARRGALGGYRLARPATGITIAAIVEAMDGPIALTDCAEGIEGGCRVESLCAMNGNWVKINAAVRHALAAVSLADMTGLPSLIHASPPAASALEASL